MCPACDPRQLAEAFNQPLSWDTSRVTDMTSMFSVRCLLPPAPHICHIAPSPPPRTLPVPPSRSPPPASRLAVRPDPCTLCLRPSAGREGFEPADHFRHVQRHGHARDVLRVFPAPRPPDLESRPLLCTRCVHCAVVRRLPPPAARSSPRTVCPACDPRQSAHKFNQPLSFDTSRVTRMRWMNYVRQTPARPVPPPICSHSLSPVGRPRVSTSL